VVAGDGKGSHFMRLLLNALHLTLRAKHLHCSGCHFEIKQLGFTAAYRARQCLLTSRNTCFSILRAGTLQPRGSESGTWHNCDLIRRHACADALPEERTEFRRGRTESGRETGKSCSADCARGMTAVTIFQVSLVHRRHVCHAISNEVAI
jgi:hypothetical protein